MMTVTATTLLRIREVERRTGLSVSEIYTRMKAGTFPRSVPIGRRAVGWVAEEIEQYLVERIAAARDKGRISDAP